ncbi:unnamed protein product [Lupinus luteus]|uniref:Uncharacterized protein n=1 Tax=Lupinus luteus TaxID=3873 RepID=A0AAV1WQC5_LUPLU
MPQCHSFSTDDNEFMNNLLGTPDSANAYFNNMGFNFNQDDVAGPSSFMVEYNIFPTADTTTQEEQPRVEQRVRPRRHRQPPVDDNEFMNNLLGTPDSANAYFNNMGFNFNQDDVAGPSSFMVEDNIFPTADTTTQEEQPRVEQRVRPRHHRQPPVDSADAYFNNMGFNFNQDDVAGPSSFMVDDKIFPMADTTTQEEQPRVEQRVRPRHHRQPRRCGTWGHFGN